MLSPGHQLSLQLQAAHATHGDCQWTVRVSRRARRLTVRVFHDGRVEIIAPLRTSARAVEQFVGRHREWIERKQLAAFTERPAQPFPPIALELAACSQRWRIAHAPDDARLRIDDLHAGLLYIRGRVSAAPAIERLLREWVMARARDVLPVILQAIADELGAQYTRVIVRCQRTRWGSCSRRGTISPNACAMFQRPKVVRYLMIHELAHLTHMNHSKRFWRLVANHVPDFRALDRELRAGWRNVPHWFDNGAKTS